MTLHPDRPSLELVDADKKYGKELREARQQAGLTQEQFAVAIGVANGAYVARLETGARRPRLATQKKIQEVLAKYQEAQVKPRMVTLIRRLVEFDAEVQAAGMKMPAAWSKIMEQVTAEAALLEPIRMDRVRKHLRVLEQV